MKTIYILLVMGGVTGGHGVALSSQIFNSEKACEAAVAWYQRKDDSYNDGYTIAKAICIQDTR